MTQAWFSFARAVVLSVCGAFGDCICCAQESADSAAGPHTTAAAVGAETAHEAAAAPADANAEFAAAFELGLAAWRAGRYAQARDVWSALLENQRAQRAEARAANDAQNEPDLHALLHNLGNAALRTERPLAAVAYYTAALRERPREATTAINLERARAAAELDSASGRERFKDSLRTLLFRVTFTEARWLCLLGLLPLALGLFVEAVRGGTLGKSLACIGILCALAAAAPVTAYVLDDGARDVMVIQPRPIPVRSEPLPTAALIFELAPAQIVREMERWPGFVRVELDGGRRGWIRADDVFALAN